jgi:hypothetical protein
MKVRTQVRADRRLGDWCIAPILPRPAIWHHLSSLATKGVFGRASGKHALKGVHPDAGLSKAGFHDLSSMTSWNLKTASFSATLCACGCVG